MLDLERIYDDHAQALFGFLLNLTRKEADTRDVLALRRTPGKSRVAVFVGSEARTH